MRGVSLEEIAEHTKIGTRLLKALEEEQFDLLPGGIFNKGFVRAYASYLGMDEEQAVADYLQAAGQSEPDVLLIAQQNERAESKHRESPHPTRHGFPFLPVLLLVLVVVAGFCGWRLYQQRVAEQEAAHSEPQLSAVPPQAGVAPDITAREVPPSKVEASPVTTSPQAGPSAAVTTPAPTDNSASAATSGFDVEVRTKGRAWVSLKADGKYVVRGILDADQVRNLHANEEIVVWTGNAGMTEILFQGKPVPIEAGPNEARVLVFTPSGLKPSRQPASTPATQIPTQPTEQQLPLPR